MAEMTGETTGETLPLGRRALAYGVHVYTASGLVFNALAMYELFKAAPDPRWVFFWLLVAVFVDMTDGTLARKFDVKTYAALIDGRKIDDIVDFLTFTFIPLVMIVKMGWVPEPGILYIAPALIASVLGFANHGAKDEEEGYFLGFPSYWNVVALYAGYWAATSVWINVAMLLVLAILTLVPIGFMYPTLAPAKWRKFMILGGYAYTVWCLAMLPTFPNTPVWIVALSLCGPVFYGLISVIEYNKVLRKRRANTPAEPLPG